MSYCILHLYVAWCFRDLDPSCIPVSESLQDTMERTLPLLTQKILPDIKKGKTVLVVAHANSLRGAVHNHVVAPSFPHLDTNLLFPFSLFPPLIFLPLLDLSFFTFLLSSLPSSSSSSSSSSLPYSSLLPPILCPSQPLSVCALVYPVLKILTFCFTPSALLCFVCY